MAKADLGTKRACLACGMRFYDFSRSSIICPGCGAEFDPENIIKSRKGRPAAKTTSRADVDVTDDDQIEDEIEKGILPDPAELEGIGADGQPTNLGDVPQDDEVDGSTTEVPAGGEI